MQLANLQHACHMHPCWRSFTSQFWRGSCSDSRIPVPIWPKKQQARGVKPSAKPKRHFSSSQYTLFTILHRCEKMTNEAHHWRQSRSGITHLHHLLSLLKNKTTIKMERNFVIIRAPDIILYNTCCYNSILCMMSFYTKMMTMLKIRTMLLVWKCTMLLNYPLKAFRQNHNAEDVCLLFPEEHGIWWLGW